MNIMIVEDDVLVRNWLSIMLRQLNIEGLCLFEAGNGVEALEIIQDKSMDLVFTDLKMPRMNGIELLTILKQKYPDIQIAVLSSYDDFEYVRVALKHGALDYILKPELKIEDLQAVLSRCRAAGAQKSFSSSSELKNLYDYSALNPLFNRCLLHQAPESEFLYEFLGSREEETVSIIFFALRDEIMDENQAFPVVALCADVLESQGLYGSCFHTEDGFFALCYYCRSESQELDMDVQQKLLSKMYYGLSSELSQSLAYSIDDFAKKRGDFFPKTRELYKSIYVRRYYSRACRISELYRIPDAEFKELTQQIRRMSEFRNYEQVGLALLSFIKNAHAHVSCPADVKKGFTSALRALVVFAEAHPGAADSIRAFSARISSAFSAEQTEALAEEVSAFCRCLVDDGSRSPSPAVRSAKEYIDKNYMLKLTLHNVADHVHLDKSYLSLVFKKQTGIPFNEYLENVRIYHAKHLLRDTEKSITDIAEEVGFSSQNYFSKVFKAVVGVSPLRYKNDFGAK